MNDVSPSDNLPDIPPILNSAPETERKLHRDFVLRNIDFLIDVLTGEQANHTRSDPAGCPSASPEIQCRKRTTGEQFSCRYNAMDREPSRRECSCGDPLNGSDDPLDTVAAVVIAEDNRPPARRYFDTEYRGLVAKLRESVGTWEKISALNEGELEEALNAITHRRGIDQDRVRRLHELLQSVEDFSGTQGVSLRGLGGIPYTSFKNLLTEFPGISTFDAWWLMLVAFDKPIWPAGPLTDRLLCSMGLLTPDEVIEENERRRFLEEELYERQIPQLHRALAAHVVNGGIDTCGENCEIRKFLLTHRLRNQQNTKGGRVIVDLFSGAGGLSLGFTKSNWDVELAIDDDEDATDTYRLNHPEIPHKKIICSDICDVIDGGIDTLIDRSPDVVVGGPPCQSLSQAGYRSRLASDEEYSILKDERTELYREYVKVVQELRPKAIVLENVEGMANEIKDTGIRVADLVVESLESIDASGSSYKCDYRLIDCSEYGLPQNRERVFIIGIREDIAHADGDGMLDEWFGQFSGRKVEEEYDLKQALSGIPKIRRGEGGRVVPDSVRGKRSKYIEMLDLDAGTSLCFNHRAREHPMEKDRILFDQALKPGETSWDVKYKKNGNFSHLVEYDVGTPDNPRFKDKYRMLRWSEPAPTVVAHLAKDANNFVLPDYYSYVPRASGEPDNERNRGITPREAARLQSFPDDYIFLGSFTSWFRQIGNAVPPLIGKNIAEVMGECLESRRPSEFTVHNSNQAKADD